MQRAAGRKNDAMLIVTPNPAVDHTVRLRELRPGEVSRAEAGVSVAGGKGGNVARAARLLGASATVVALVPRVDGEYLRALFAAEGFDLVSVPVAGRVRTCTAMIEADGRVTLINEPGADTDANDWAHLMAVVGDRLAAAGAPSPRTGRRDIVVCSGSLPPGAPADGYAQVVRMGHAAGVEVLVDAGGTALALAIDAGADLVCPNVSEAESVLATEFGAAAESGDAGGRAQRVELVDDDGHDVRDRAAGAAAALHARGAGYAAVTAGAAGAALCGPGTALWLPAPAVTARNPIGAGDSFLAGVAAARQGGADWPRAVRRGLAAGSASVEQDAAGVVDRARVDELDRGAAQR